MPNAVRLHLRQQMANYRKPASFLIKESFPLPPYSSVIGMVHAACKWWMYHPMTVSIQGKTAGSVSDYATNYVFGIAYDPTRHQMKIDAGGGKFDGINIGPKNYELLTDVELILHIVPDDPAQIDEIIRGVLNPPQYLSLGRYEDLVQIESAEVVELAPTEDNAVANYDIYVPKAMLNDYESRNLVGTTYRLNKVFTIEKVAPRKYMRHWSTTVLAMHVAKSALIVSDAMMIDQKYGDIAFLA